MRSRWDTSRRPLDPAARLSIHARVLPLCRYFLPPHAKNRDAQGDLQAGSATRTGRVGWAYRDERPELFFEDSGRRTVGPGGLGMGPERMAKNE